MNIQKYMFYGVKLNTCKHLLNLQRLQLVLLIGSITQISEPLEQDVNSFPLPTLRRKNALKVFDLFRG